MTLTLTSKAFRDVLKEMAEVRDAKVRSYGDSRYREPNPALNLIMAFSDVHRKYIRLRQQTLDGDTAGLRETYMDMANYAAMGVQLIDNDPLVGRDTVLNRFPIQQVAIYTTIRPHELQNSLNVLFGLKDNWVEDDVIADGEVWGEPVYHLRAKLMFQYNLIPGVEFEILYYENFEQSWLARRSPREAIGLSHMGLHVESVEDSITLVREVYGFKIAQKVRTHVHSNPAIAGKREYTYVIFDSRERLGFDLKLIQRHML